MIATPRLSWFRFLSASGPLVDVLPPYRWSLPVIVVRGLLSSILED
jgi:hypothetical protein